MKLNQIILGDCLEVMKEMRDNSVDLILTDPPYNAKNIGPNQKVYSLGKMQIPEKEYKKFCKDWFKQAKRISRTIIFTPGISNTHYYPQPFWQICWHKPSAVSFNRMQGFNVWEPIFVYGKNIKSLGHDYILQNTFNFSKGPEKDHPCPKPLNLMKFLVEKFSKEGDIVFDPFMGSGTTALAAKQMKRKFLGIEMNLEYIKIANQRLRQEILL